MSTLLVVVVVLWLMSQTQMAWMVPYLIGVFGLALVVDAVRWLIRRAVDK